MSVIGDRHQQAFDYDVTGSLQNVLGRLEDASHTPPWRVAKGNLLEQRPGPEPGSTISYENDTAGRRIRKTERSVAGEINTTTYHYDHAGRLREARLPDGDIARYRYDAFTRRIEKKLVPKERTDLARSVLIATVTAAPPAPPVTTRFLYDGGALCAELHAEGPASARTLTPHRVHVHLPGTLTPLLHIEGGQLYTVITDHLGAPRELVDTAGRIAWTAHFSAWGILLEQTRAPNTPDVSSPFRLLGQYHDPETNLCHTRFRYFDPETARWLTPDPLGFDGGRNLLAFDGSPVIDVDPWGLACARKQTGIRGERYARKLLKKMGYTDIQSIENNSGHGIDLAARNPSGQLEFIEVKTTSGTRTPGLSRPQRRGQEYVEDRLGRAADGDGHWAHTRDPATGDRAESLQEDLERDGFRGKVIKIREGAPPGERVIMEDW